MLAACCRALVAAVLASGQLSAATQTSCERVPSPAAAILDAVFPIQARYGGPTTGVRAVVGTGCRDHRGV